MRWLLVALLAGSCVQGYAIREDADGGTQTTGTGPGDEATTQPADESSESGSGEQGSTDETGGEEVEYGALAVPGGLDRVFVWRRDAAADQCAVLVLVRPGTPNNTLPTPDGWGTELARVSDRALDCDALPDGPIGSQATPADATGTVNWPATPGFPCLLDIDVRLTFGPEDPWTPATIDMIADDVVVQGC